MKEGYPKKLDNPVNTNSDGSQVFGLITVNLCSSLGQDWKNS